MSQAKTFWLVMSTILLLAGFIVIDTIFTQASGAMMSRRQNINTSMLKTYASKTVTFTYPPDYTVGTKELDPGKTIITVSGPAGRIAIFRQADYPDRSPVWVFPHFDSRSRNWLPTDPTEKMVVKAPSATLGKESEYGVWLFFVPSDTAAKAALHAIAGSIKVVY